MLDLRFLVDHPKEVEASLLKRNRMDLIPFLKDLTELDKDRRALIQTTESLKHQKNTASQEIAKIKQSKGDATSILEQMKNVSSEIKLNEEKLTPLEEKIEKTLLEIPNLVHESVPAGKSTEDNKEIRKWGEIPKFKFTPLTHDVLGEKMGILDFRAAGEVSGARFSFLKGLGARLEHALIQFMLKTHRGAGYEDIVPPYLVHRRSLVGTGQLPKFEEDLFKIQGQEYFLIPTAEVPVTNFYRGQILAEEDLPKKYVAFSPCFRSEAGSYGKDTKGLKRQHQFHKVELVKFVKPEDSQKELENLTLDAEKILQLLNLPYRVVVLCGGDMSFSSTKTYDIEVWSPGSQQYMEISSCSSFADYQARRASIKYRDKATQKVQYVHTLNGSGLAVGRTLIALLENYQTEDGKLNIPSILQPFL